ncbi:uncharacterized protein JCM15063_004767 [Sporobolomyces koalae]|uniref:uncharacterized protein n=1 Tax=Sporobolomyces koalae TaxID=500713 RepID=UPI00316F4CE4
MSLEPPTAVPVRLKSPPELLQLLPTEVRARHVSIRVRTDKKMNSLIKFSLTALRVSCSLLLETSVIWNHKAETCEGLLPQDEPDVPIVLHCFPSTSFTRPDPVPTATHGETKSKGALQGTLAIPKLVSVVEVIKREYQLVLQSVPSTLIINDTNDPSNKGKGKAVEDQAGQDRETRQGLHQYSLLTTFETLGIVGIPRQVEQDPELERERQELVQMQWLTGKTSWNRPRMKHSPCLVIVLSTRPEPQLDQDAQFTHQPPPPLPKKRAGKRPAETEGATAMDENPTPAGSKRKRRRRKKSKTDAVNESEPVNPQGGAMDIDGREAGVEAN